MDLLNIDFLISLVSVNLFLLVYFRYQDLNKPEPLTHLQYFLSQYGLKEELDKIRDEDKRKLAVELFEAGLERKDIIKAINKIKDEQ